MKEGPLVLMLDRQRVQQAAADDAKKLVDAAALASERLADATKEAEETATAAAAAAAAAIGSSMARAIGSSMARDSHMRERIFFTHSDPHGAAPQHGRFLTGMPDDDSLQRPIVA